MTTRVNRPLKVIAFNANGIGMQRYELSKQLQGLHIDVALFSETHLKPQERFFIPNYHFYRTDGYPGRKGIPHNHVDLPPLVSVDTTGVFIPIGNSAVTVLPSQVISIVRANFRVCHFRSYWMVLSEKVRRPLAIAVSREPQGTLRTM
jgi:hypothetical protein